MIAPAPDLHSIIGKLLGVEFCKTVLLVEQSVALGIGEQTQGVATLLPDVRNEAVPQNSASDTLTGISGIDGEQAEVPGVLAQSMATAVSTPSFFAVMNVALF